MADSDTITDAIVENAAAGLSSVTHDTTTVSAKSVDEQVKAAQFVAADEQKDTPPFGLRFMQFRNPGTT